MKDHILIKVAFKSLQLNGSESSLEKSDNKVNYVEKIVQEVIKLGPGYVGSICENIIYQPFL
jgi:hypothetical protein